MSIKPRGKGFEAYVAVNGQRIRRILPTLEEAQRFEANAKLAILEGRSIETPTGTSSKNWTLATAIERCHRAHWVDTKGEKTVMLNAEAALAFFGRNVYVSEVTTQRVADWIEKLRKDRNSNGTINRKLSALSKALKYAYQNDALEKLPYMPRQKESQGRLRFLTKQEEETMLNLILRLSDQELWDCVAIMLDTGLRCGELFKLEGQDVRNNQITIWDTKNGKEHTVPLTQRASRIVSERLAQYGRGKLFPVSYDSLEKRFKKVAEQLSWDDVTLHVLRHTFASRLVQRGVPIQTVSKLLNHSTIQITMRYAHLAPSNLVDAVRVLEDA